MIEPDLNSCLTWLATPFNVPLFKSSALSPTKSPILPVAFFPKLILPFASVVSVPIVAPVVFLVPLLSSSPAFTGKVGTPANTPTALFTTFVWSIVAVDFVSDTFLTWVTASVPIFIVPPTFTSCISWSIPTPTLSSPFILIVPVLYTPLVYLESAKAERPISPPGKTFAPIFLWALKLLFILNWSGLVLERGKLLWLNSTVLSSEIPGLKTVIIPKLPLPFKLISLLLSAFIKTLPNLLASLFGVRRFITILLFVDKLLQSGSQ